MPPSRGPARRSRAACPKWRRVKSARLSSPAGGVWRSRGSINMRSLAGRLSRGVKRMGLIFWGMKSLQPAGKGWRRPLCKMEKERWASLEGRSSFSRPRSLQRSMPQGFSVSRESGPPSRRQPSMWREMIFPPKWGPASKRVTSWPARRRYQAAASPAMPPPRMAVFMGRVGRGGGPRRRGGGRVRAGWF